MPPSRRRTERPILKSFEDALAQVAARIFDLLIESLVLAAASVTPRAKPARIAMQESTRSRERPKRAPALPFRRRTGISLGQPGRFPAPADNAQDLWKVFEVPPQTG